MSSLEATQKQLSDELSSYSTLQKEFQKNLTAREQYDSQLNENLIVKEELDLLKSGDVVYKLTGPALIKHDLNEAKENVKNRINYIQSEIKRLDDLLKATEKKQEVHREAINKLQQQLQQVQLKASIKK